MNPLIHIGYPKTATTWFQKNFYPFVEDINFIKRKDVLENLIHPNSFNFNKDNIKGYFNSNNRIIICEEIILGSNMLTVKKRALRLKAAFPDAKIVIFIREQADIIASKYYQYIKGGGNYNIDKFVSNFFANITLPKFAKYEYDKVIKLYYHLFRKENVYVFLYEDFLSNNIEFIKTFQERFNLIFNINNIDLTKKNEKYRKNIMRIAQLTNVFTNRKAHFKNYIIHVPYWYTITRKAFYFLNKYKIFGKIPSPLEILGKKNYNYIKDFFKESNNILYNELNLKKIAEYDYSL